jgi:hypothetical protein
MQIIGMTKTGINIFDPNQKDLTSKINTNPQRAEPDRSQALTNMADQMAFLSSGIRENNIRAMTSEREVFYSRSNSLQNFNPGQHGALSVEDEIRLATETGFAGIVDGKLTPSFSLTWTNDPNMKQDITTNSPLDFMQKINNLRSLFEHLGDNAVNYTTQFENALGGIIDDLLDRGGMYVNADREGVADSIRAMWSGTEGKYTADDLTTMAVLAFEAHAGAANGSGSEIQVGRALGFEALNIEMARRAGKLSDVAYETVKDAFAKRVDEITKLIDEYSDKAKNDPFGPKGVAYSPARPELVYKSIEVMLGALDNTDFNQGLREAIETLENMHNAQRDNQLLSNGEADWRFNMPFISPRERVMAGDLMPIQSRYFAEFLGKPEWAINGNPFSFNSTI